MPAVNDNGSPINATGWQICVENTFIDPTAYSDQQLNTSHNGWYLRFFASNDIGSTCSNTVQIAVLPSSDARLYAVLDHKISEDDSHAGTAAEPKEVSVEVEYTALSVTVSDIETISEFATIAFFGTDANFEDDGGGDLEIVLAAGTATDIYVKVIAENGTTSLYYKVSIYRQDDTNARLGTVLGREIGPDDTHDGFIELKEAIIEVPYAVWAVNREDITAEDGRAEVTFYGTDSDLLVEMTGDVELETGMNEVYIKVVAADGETTLYYKVTIMRTAPSTDVTLYSVLGQEIGTDDMHAGTAAEPKEASIDVAYAVAAVGADDIEAVDDNADVYFSGTDSFYIEECTEVALETETGTDVYIIVTAEDETTELYYKVTIYRGMPNTNAGLDMVLDQEVEYDASEHEGTVSDPEIVSVSMDYSVAAAGKDDIEAESELATVVFYGTDSTYSEECVDDVPLAAGAVTDVYVKVTAEDVTVIRYYKVRIYRAAAPTYELAIAAGTGGAITAGSSGYYAEGTVINISATAHSHYSFNQWTSTGGGSFGSTASAGTTFTMPANAATITANFTYNGGGGSGGSEGSSGSSAPTPTPTYKADVSGNNASGSTLPVNVNTNAGSATVDLGTPAGGIFSREGTTVITVPSIPEVNTYILGISASSLCSSQSVGSLTFVTGTGSITIPDNMLFGIPGTEGKKAGITIGQGDKSDLPSEVQAAIGDRPIVQLTLTMNGTQTEWNNPNAPVTVSIPYTPTAAELANPEAIVIWYIDGSGKAVSVPNGRYDQATGIVTFSTTHFSYYAVSYNQVNFKDVASGAWYRKAVSFIAAREITTGTGNGNFSPEAKLTRGQFVVMLMKAYGIAPDANPKDNFADAGSAYYTGYMAAAKRLGISAGVGNKLFAPEKEITRQEMFTLLYNALKAIGKLPQGNSGKLLSNFSDESDIAPWAKEAMTLLINTGTVGGSAGKLAPLSTTTRAEMAQVLYYLLGK